MHAYNYISIHIIYMAGSSRLGVVLVSLIWVAVVSLVALFLVTQIWKMFNEHESLLYFFMS